MNLLYISCLIGSKWSGPNKSVPSQIVAQAKYDNVLWFNINNTPKDRWNADVNFINSNDVPDLSIERLPEPFNKPDLVIFEGIYFFAFCRIAKQLRKMKIPYIIIPRSGLTSAGQKSKRLKKKVANFVFFKRFFKNAAAIQYLTKDEQENSGYSWNKISFVIPNGIEKKQDTKVWKEKSLKGVFIGRLDIYQKGLDLLLEACDLIQKELRLNNFRLNIYGPDRNGSKATLNGLVEKYNLGDIVFIYDSIFDEVKESVLLDSDFFVLTSRFEGLPMGLIEALSYGIPCLVTIGSNMAKEIAAAEAGWASNISVEGIANELMKILKLESLEGMGKNALELSEQYDWNEIGRISSEKYRNLK